MHNASLNSSFDYRLKPWPAMCLIIGRPLQ